MECDAERSGGVGRRGRTLLPLKRRIMIWDDGEEAEDIICGGDDARLSRLDRWGGNKDIVIFAYYNFDTALASPEVPAS